MNKQFKMAEVKDICTKQRVVIEILSAEGLSHIEIYRHLNSVYGEHIVDVTTVRCWPRHFKSGETETGDKAPSGWLAMAVTVDSKSYTDMHPPIINCLAL
jgi:hypothetical protein